MFTKTFILINIVRLSVCLFPLIGWNSWTDLKADFHWQITDDNRSNLGFFFRLVSPYDITQSDCCAMGNTAGLSQFIIIVSFTDHYQISPTKLSKNELEDLYFALLENNIQLKKTVNVQQERIKVLSTKMQRMTSAQNSLRADENNNCCVATKAMVRQQKETLVLVPPLNVFDIMKFELVSLVKKD